LRGPDSWVRTAKVFTRVRPPLERERRSYLPYADAVAVHPCGRTIALSENGAAAALSGAAAVEDGLASPPRTLLQRCEQTR